MVNRLKLNEKTLRDAELRPGVSYQIFDTEVIGFAVRVQSSGARTFTIDYRHAGRQRRMTCEHPGEAPRAWPIRYLMWRETVNDEMAVSRSLSPSAPCATRAPSLTQGFRACRTASASRASCGFPT